MQRLANLTVYSATDLAGFLECEHLAVLDRLALDDDALRGQRSAQDEQAELLARKGDTHERAYLARLRVQGLEVVDIAVDGGSLDDKAARTLQAMRAGVPVIYQATLQGALQGGALAGHADFLRRVDGEASALGPWRYEVADTKLARTPKAKFLVQLAFYSHLLTVAQGAEPRQMHVVLGDFSERNYRVADYARYFRSLLARFLAHVGALDGGAAPATYPLPCAFCDLCHWRERCERQRVDDDHLCQVAGISRVQWLKLQESGVGTMAALASLAADAAVPKMQPDTLAKLRSQAALQHAARTDGRRRLELLPLDADGRRGFQRLPLPDAGDLYFDMEGDPLEDGGLEYLFGVGDRLGGSFDFRAFWAHDRAAECEAFEAFVDFVVARRRERPGAHVYHYASYEESALKRLATLHGTREAEVDAMLRGHWLVDLYKVVRESLRTSEPGLSIKNIERFYRPARAGGVQTAGASVVFYERWRDTGDETLLRDIEAYNRDDVESTAGLHEWLLGLRPAGLPWAREDAAGLAEAQAASERTQRIEARLAEYRRKLVDPLPAERSAWSTDDHLRELAWQMLDFHRRADKPHWWAYYARMEADEAEWMDDLECLAGLQADPEHPPQREKQSIRYSYTVPQQESKLADGDSCVRCDTGESLGELSYDEASGRASVKISVKRPAPPARLSLGPGGPPNAEALVDALYRFADSVLDRDARYAALEGLLRREPPRLHGFAPGAPVVPAGADLLQASIAAVRAMDRTLLYVQGPPGAGKTYTGARLIVDALARGLRVGVTSNSHKAINNLLAGVVQAAAERGVHVDGCRKISDDAHRFEGFFNCDDNGEVWGNGHALVAGTVWLFADERADQRLDLLFVDEAGQVSLANLVAAGTSARNIVLLGDQMQLAQPVQGAHPGRSGDSALDWLLDGAATIAPDRGIFLATTWRMHPAVCAFISEAVYDGRLLPEPHNAAQSLVLGPDAHRLLKPAGIVHARIAHAGCSQRSRPEAELARDLYASALRQRYTDKDGIEHAMTPDNVLVVAPYNAQVNLLKATLPAGAKVGTVDKFQGQEAELVIVSMTTSSEHDLPRFIEFLYSKHRINVAISRAKCLAIVIANPALMAIKCSTPEQMALVNTLCWVAEVQDGGRFSVEFGVEGCRITASASSGLAPPSR
ncbi:MAG: TM0106 family RecB-like putative nuclease [Burkholderiaceae bacterium]|nr:TM0106 family RecB-like putative nuclease [Burkholderiaceae bacterium]